VAAILLYSDAGFTFAEQKALLAQSHRQLHGEQHGQRHEPLPACETVMSSPA
jgi:hypothetical protein